MMATAAVVEARASGDASAIRRYNENGWLAMRGHMDCNIAAPNRQVVLASRNYSVRLLDWADNVGAAAIIIEAGYCPNPICDKERRLTSSLRSIAKKSMSGADLLMENGSRPEMMSLSSIRHAIDMSDDNRFGIHFNVTKAFAYGYTLEDICTIDKTHIRSVQISIPENTMEVGCGRVSVGSFETSLWGPVEMQQIVQHFSSLPIIIDSTNQHDWALVDSGAWESIAILRDYNLTSGDSKDNSLGQVESS